MMTLRGVRRRGGAAGGAAVVTGMTRGSEIKVAARTQVEGFDVSRADLGILQGDGGSGSSKRQVSRNFQTDQQEKLRGGGGCCLTP